MQRYVSNLRLCSEEMTVWDRRQTEKTGEMQDVKISPVKQSPAKAPNPVLRRQKTFSIYVCKERDYPEK